MSVARGNGIDKKSKKILIIDDDYDFLESLHLMLANDGHDVLPVSNGEEGITKYNEFRPDIVFLDIKMPGINGYETFLCIKNNDRDARIIFISTYMLDDAKYAEATKRSIAAFIDKPIERFRLRKLIKQYAK